MNNLMRFFTKILLITNSLILLFVINFISNKIWLFKYECLSILLYIIIPLILTAVCIRLCDFFTGDSIEGNVMPVELVNDTYLPIYLGYFFIALSINELYILLVMFVVLLLLSVFSLSAYFNPLFSIYGYNIYKINKENGISVFVICKKKKSIDEYKKFTNLRRINDFTYIERRQGDGPDYSKN